MYASFVSKASSNRLSSPFSSLPVFLSQIVKRLDNGNNNRQTRKKKQAGSSTTEPYPSCPNPIVNLSPLSNSSIFFFRQRGNPRSSLTSIAPDPLFFPVVLTRKLRSLSSGFVELSDRSIDLVGMAARAACREVVSLFGNNPGNSLSLSRLGPIGTRSRARLLFSPPGCDFRRGRNFSELAPANKRRLFLVDTLALVRRLEAQGIPTKQAEAITSSITEVLSDSLENVSHSYVSNEEMQKGAMAQESNLSKFKSEVQNSQGNHFSLLQSETEKLRTDIEKLHSEFRYEVDKVTAGQRLDLNLERGRIRDELAKQSAETADLTNKLDREIHALRAQLEVAKYEVIKYCIGSLVSISAVGLAVLRVMM